MRYLPVYLDAQALPCLLVGGGEVAARKLALLQRVGGQVTVVAPELGPELRECRDFIYLEARFDPSHLEGQRLVIAATDDLGVNAEVAAACKARGIPVNVVDAPALCTFIVPAIVDRSPLIVSISTGGAAPVLATRVRERIESLLPRHYARLTAFMGEQRDAVKAAHPTPRSRRRFWQHFLVSDVPELLATDEAQALQAFARLLSEDLGERLALRQSVIELSSADPADLTLRALALLGDADYLVYDPGVPAAIRDYARRDATTLHPAELAEAPVDAGHIVHVRLPSQPQQFPGEPS
jgi:uroporphyrin-III C-methyltransferase/precorrin-2 dehydrogenase/sirohydrochlorin ferrochelatase